MVQGVTPIPYASRFKATADYAWTIDCRFDKIRPKLIILKLDGLHNIPYI